MNHKRITNQILEQKNFTLNSTLKLLLNMKKLFSYLLIASVLTFSSCTNYDDQFADLEASIEALKTQVAGFSTLSASLTTLQSSVAEVKTSIANLPGNEALEADLEALSATVSALTASLESLAGIVATGESTTEAINAAVAAIEANQDALATALADVATAQAAAAVAASTSSEAATQALADAVAELKAVGTTDLAALTSAIEAVEAAQAAYQATSSDEATALSDAIAALATAQASGSSDLSALINAVQTAQTAANAVAIANQTATSAAITASQTASTNAQTALSAAIAALTTAEAAGTADLTALINAVQAAQTVAATAAAANQAEMLASNSALADTQAALTAAIEALQADLDTVGTTTAATKIVADLLSESLALLQVGQTANTASIAQLIASIAALPEDADIANVITVVSAAVTASTQEMIASILENNDVLSGGLNITNAAELAYAVSVANQVGIINGDLKVTKSVANGLSAADISAVTSLIKTVVGKVTVTTNADLDFSGLTSISGNYSVTGNDVSDDNLTSVGGTVNLNYGGGYVQPSLTNTGAITLTNYSSAVLAGSLTTTTVDLSGFTTAAPSLTISGTLNDAAGDLDKLTDATSINTGAILINNATSGSILSLTAKVRPTGATISTASATVVVLNGDITSGTLSVTLESATSLVINASDITGTQIGIDAPLASVSMANLSGITGDLDVISASSFSAPALASVTGFVIIASPSIDLGLLETVSESIDMSAGTLLSLPKLESIAASSTLSATTISLPVLGQATGTLTINGDLSANALESLLDMNFTGSSFTANGLVEVGNITLTGPTSVSLPSLTTAGTITADEAVVFDAGLLDVSSTINTASATTLILGDINAVETSIADRTTIVTLKLNTSNGFSGGDFASLNDLTVQGTGVITLTSNNSSLESVNIKGAHTSVDIAGTASLTSLVTAGTIETLSIDASGLVSFNPGHAVVNLSSLTVTNNASLVSLTTSTDYLGDLTVTGNASLTTVDFSSYQNVSNSTTTATIDIYGNSLSAAITTAIAANGAVAFKEATIVSSGLATLKTAIIAHVAAYTEAKLSLDVRPDNITINGTAGGDLTTVTQVTGSVLDGTDYINTSDEFALIN